MLDISFVSGKEFRDDKNFPHGFSRSGNFSRNESEVLAKGGIVANALLSGDQKPKSKAHKQFLAVCRGEKDAESLFEKLWLKYVDLVGRKRVVFSFASTGNLAASDGRVSKHDVLGS